MSELTSRSDTTSIEQGETEELRKELRDSNLRIAELLGRVENLEAELRQANKLLKSAQERGAAQPQPLRSGLRKIKRRFKSRTI